MTTEQLHAAFLKLLSTLGVGAGTVLHLAASVLLVAVVLALRWVILRYLASTVIGQGPRRYHLRKAVSYAASFLIIAGLGGVWIDGFRQLGTFLGLLSAGVAVALKDWLVNLAGWVYILWRHPFHVGDRVELGEHRGDVVDQRLFEFSVLEVGGWVDADQSTGRLIHIPNSHVLTRALVNYDRGLGVIWHEIPVLVTFESDWRRAREVLQALGDAHTAPPDEAQRRLDQLTERFLVVYHHLTPTVYVTVRDAGVLLTLRLLCPPRGRRGTEQAVWEGVLDAFAADPSLELAYPTQRLVGVPGPPPRPEG